MKFIKVCLYVFILLCITNSYSGQENPNNQSPPIEDKETQDDIQVEITNLIDLTSTVNEHPIASSEIENATSLEDVQDNSISNENIISSLNLPRIDWTSWFTEVSDRRFGNPLCESSWAIASADVIEGNWNMKYNQNKPIKISARELMDCANPNVDPCDETINDLYNGLGYILINGVNIESSWPYIGSSTQTCNGPIEELESPQEVKDDNISDSYDDIVSDIKPQEYVDDPKLKILISDYLSCESCDFNQWISWLSQGPIATYIDSSILIDYQGGILQPNNCIQPDLKVVVVGYDPDTDTFVVRNSLGPNWGEGGYMRIKRDMSNNSCFLTYFAYLPIIS